MNFSPNYKNHNLWCSSLRSWWPVGPSHFRGATGHGVLLKERGSVCLDSRASNELKAASKKARPSFLSTQ